ncbi:MAG: nucleotidyltransferase domain-containing protein [Gammaproteobacteria bacterium]|nr:nucleotidyltransferase domain-containing protein [Gammaproteobacteria bacterium]
MPQDSLASLQSRLTAALEGHGEILEAYLFGSQVAGHAHAHSDIDVAVYVAQDHPLDNGFGYQAELTATLMAALETNAIDVVILNRAPPLLYHRVLAHGVRLVSRNLAETTTREGYALSRYCDYLPQLAKIGAGRRGTITT